MAQFEIEIKLPLKNLKETLKFLTEQGFQETAPVSYTHLTLPTIA